MTSATVGKPLVNNVLRGVVAEAIIALALEPIWTWCSADYASWDFERADGLRLEVKQSAARQSWNTEKPSKAIFDVAARSRRYEATGWIEEVGRAAHIYIFAHHPVFDETADHRDPGQWVFYVVPSIALPDVRQIALGTIQKLSLGVTVSALAETVQEVSQKLTDGNQK